MSVQLETMKESSATAVPGTAGLKLRINLRDRHMIRKRHRSSSPSNSSDSSSTNSSNKTRSHTVSAGGSKTVLQAKRNKREPEENEHEAVTPPEEDSPPLSDGSVSPRKKSPTLQNHKLEVKKVKLGPNGTTKLRSIRFDSEETTEDGVRKKILLVDMSSDVHSEKVEVPDPSCSPPASPVNDENSKNFESDKIDSKVKSATASAIKRLSRDELERLIMEQMVLAIREKGATGQLEKKLEEADALVERYRRRTEALQKQVSDLELVVRRFVQQAKSRNQTPVPPVKVTRSVGLQINLNNAAVASAVTAVTATQVSVIKKPLASVLSETQKPAVDTPASTPTITIKPSAPAQPAPQVTVSPVAQPLPGNNNNNSSSNNNQQTSFARVPIPPSFTMQEPEIASYVPSQAVPRYRTLLPRKPEEQSAPPKLATYVNINGVVNKPNANVIQNPPRVRASTVPAAQMVDSLAKRPGLTVTSTNMSVTTVPAGPISPPPVQPTVPMPRWTKGPGLGPVTRATTVNKVTLPNGLPNVIDLTSEDLEKEKEKTTLTQLTNPNTPTKPQIAKITPTVATQNTQIRGVALKSTSLNGRFQHAKNSQPTAKPVLTHPAPLPAPLQGQSNPAWKPMPPKPTLDIKRVANGIVLSWNMQTSSNHADIASYQLFAYQEGSDPPSANGTVWKRVGDVKALPLPMACTLTQFLEGHRYHFAVRAMDVHGRAGPYSEPGTIVLS